MLSPDLSSVSAGVSAPSDLTPTLKDTGRGSSAIGRSLPAGRQSSSRFRLGDLVNWRRALDPEPEEPAERDAGLMPTNILLLT